MFIAAEIQGIDPLCCPGEIAMAQTVEGVEGMDTRTPSEVVAVAEEEEDTGSLSPD